MIELKGRLHRENGKIRIKILPFTRIEEDVIRPVIREAATDGREGTLMTVNCLCCRKSHPLVTHPRLYGRVVCLGTGRLHLEIGQEWFLATEDTFPYLADPTLWEIAENWERPIAV